MQFGFYHFDIAFFILFIYEKLQYRTVSFFKLDAGANTYI